MLSRKRFEGRARGGEVERRRTDRNDDKIDLRTHERVNFIQPIRAREIDEGAVIALGIGCGERFGKPQKRSGENARSVTFPLATPCDDRTLRVGVDDRDTLLLCGRDGKAYRGRRFTRTALAVIECDLPAPQAGSVALRIAPSHHHVITSSLT